MVAPTAGGGPDDRVRVEALVEHSLDAIIVTDAFGVVNYASPGVRAALGCEPGELIGRQQAELFPADELDDGFAAMAQLHETPGAMMSVSFHGRHVDGSLRALRGVARNLLHVPSVAGIVINVSDVTEHLRAERSLREMSAAIESSADAIFGSTLDGLITSWNRAAATLSGYAAHEAIGAALSVLFPPERGGEAELIIGRVREGETVREHQTLWRRRDGSRVHVSCTASPVRDERGIVSGMSMIVQDATERRQAAEALRHATLHDPLTRLPNRDLLMDRLRTALAQSQRRGKRVAVLIVDLDSFKDVNDSLGHATGDLVLAEMAGRLAGAVRAGDTVARFGGDELVIVRETADEEETSRFAARLLECMTEPVELETGSEIFISACIGAAIARPGIAAEDLVGEADAALYRAKERGRSVIEFFDEDLRSRARARVDLGAALRRALERGELFLVHQPVVTLGNVTLRGSEALIRWAHPERGVISPLDFIPLAEETGLIVPVGEWVLSEALRQISRWRRRFPLSGDYAVSVNLSARQLASPDLVAVVARALASSAVPASCVYLEITETTLLSQVASNLDTLRLLRGLGVHLAVDDFGTGYSSLSYLRQLPIDSLKIDRSFIDGLGVDSHDTAIVEAVIGLAKVLELDVVAEGVETRRQLQLLREMGCRTGQGFLFSEPLDTSEMELFLSAASASAGRLTTAG
ncbi:MAG: EAL domain-containing protein [Acidimicrobiales bacterium]|jgi:diguanylate cyclase (GGDEF)-like protein/PAS domain S-box-containing protein